MGLSEPELLRTTIGDFPLQEYRLRLGGREWSVLHAGAVLTHDDEVRMLEEMLDRLPYGAALWPASIALAHELVGRAERISGRRVLELGAGTGLPGIVAASLGGRVSQTERNEVALSICRRNGERNGVAGIEYRLADWRGWEDEGRYDLILGSDILYATTLHPCLREIFETNLAPGGRVLLSDPFRGPTFRLMEELEEAGWEVSINQWTVGETPHGRSIGVFELAPPAPG